MAKKSLGKLLQIAGILQQAAKLTGNYSELNDTILQILREHLTQVKVQFAANRPHDWEDHFAVLEVIYGGYILKIPIPELNALDKEISIKVREIMSDPNATKNFVLSTWNWNGYNSMAVIRANSRQEAFELSAAASDQKDPLLRIVFEYDDGNRVVIHTEHGCEFYGWRINHRYSTLIHQQL